VTRPDDHVIVLFGATGDLAKRKLLPGLFHLARAGLLPDGYRIVGSAPAQYAPTLLHDPGPRRRWRLARATPTTPPPSPRP
jgi:glucose-6-phosphate 1-dehydrogenase